MITQNNKFCGKCSLVCLKCKEVKNEKSLKYYLFFTACNSLLGYDKADRIITSEIG